MRIFTVLCVCLSFLLGVQAQSIDIEGNWPAKWIRAAEGPQNDFGVFHFRKSFELDSLPAQLLVHSSGDNRYQLYVNGERITWGPLRGDLEHWYYETTDLAPFLQKGKNTLAAVVWNYGGNPPDAQFTVTTAFLLCADDRQYRFLNTGSSWKAAHNPGVSENPVDRKEIGGYYGAGSKEKIDARSYLWDWEKTDFDDADWQAAVQIETAMAKANKWASRWKLMPRTLPLERLELEKALILRGAEGSARIAEKISFEEKTAFPYELAIPAHQEVRLIIDQGYETTAYPQFEWSGGKDAQIVCKYSEAPSIGPIKQRNKGHRDEIEGKSFYGYSDIFIADGGLRRVFAPLWWRAYRYLVLTIKTEEAPIVLHDIRGLRSTYPFESKAEFELRGEHLPVSSAEIQQIQEVGTRTLELCAHETFMDCPYYEESQFEGDTRIEALVSYRQFGDGRLGRQAIEQFAWSINSEGFLSARYPSNSTYYIPNYSLAWIGMLYDYLMYIGEPEFIRKKLPVSRQILSYFLARQREDGSVAYPDYHNFVDWSFHHGEAPVDSLGYSALVDLHMLLAMQWAAFLEAEVGEKYYADLYAGQIPRLQALIKEKYWNEAKGLFTDTSVEGKLSQHSNSLAILTGVISGEAADRVMEKVLEKPEGMTQATLFWSFYVFEALGKTNLAAEYLGSMQVWQEALAVGVSTWPETGINSRSECHAWGSSPNYHFSKLIAGIRPLAPGFDQVAIRPQLGNATHLNCSIPHPRGELSLSMKQKSDQTWEVQLALPEGVIAFWNWKGKKQVLQGPTHYFVVKN